jgi:outer membrane lipoprotein SlyB
MISQARDDSEFLDLKQFLDGRMNRISTKAIMLTMVAALVLSVLPGMSADAQTRRTRRRTAPPASVVPAGTELRVRLNDTLSSKESRAGDRFSATVVNPSRYEEAKITGHIRSIRKSGRVEGRTTMSLAFDSIRLADGRTAVMRGEVLRVYDSESAKNVDEEGRVQSGGRGKQTLKRGGIGAVAGAVIGGIAGGGKGAAIGILVGGAAGAGSIAIQGSKELKIERGTEMLVRVNRR